MPASVSLDSGSDLKALAIELGKRKITVNCVAPGLIDTEILDEQEIGRAHV